MKILHLGPEDLATSWQRIKSFQDLGHIVYPIYYSRLSDSAGPMERIYRAVRRRIGRPAEQNSENLTILDTARRERPDIVFIEKGLTVRPKTLVALRRAIPNAVLVCYSLDDMMNPGNQSDYYLKCLSLYDVHFTTKTYNVAELLEKGARRVELTGNAFSPHVHRPVDVSEEDKATFGSDVSFVGGYEHDRAQMLNYLSEAGVVVRVWGNNWKKFKNPHPKLRLELKPAYGDDYGRVVCSSKILLGFLRKANRDVETTRTIEIPAFGGFLLAERTDAQRRLFQEGREAEYFDGQDELLEKIQYYLERDDERRVIAKAGFERCQNSAYSYDDRLADLLNICSGIARSKEVSS